MKFTSLGRTGLKVSRLCLGTMNFGKATEEKESFAIMDRALELGINFFDTANRYGEPLAVGRTEEIIGRWMAQGGRRREQIVLATKGFGPMGPGANDEGLSAYHLRMACNDSLRRLQTDHVDLYQMHHIDRGLPHFKSKLEFLDGDLSNLSYPPHVTPGAPWEEIWQQMEQLVREGKTLYVGSSNFAAWNIAQANEKAAHRHFLGLVSEQSLYNLTQRMVELEMLPVCRAYGLGFIPWSPLGGGLLAGALQKAQEGRRANLKPTDQQKQQLEAYEALCRDLGEEPANVALAWLLHNPVVTAPIIGPRTLDQLESAVKSIEISLDPEVLRKLDEIWPGPGNQAPEAYAW
ncbi:aldo/keto reductase [candidate division KSB3 bacterium]|uniref:Aldo/keto reductase n=1 Tax=candidate division KSB3 bacterium TaxID=2044937 RepID=A0A9D5Q628_9BACT|nr:aldo/keto reductase [candidate division KSB3 bacterium]MBD3325424.1 aldo/keto reductase [candidate division KSB3 bacterium]